MAGCGGNCNCVAKREGLNLEGEPRDRVTIADALARVMIDNKVVSRTLELHKLYGYEADDIIVMINLEKSEGKF